MPCNSTAVRTAAVFLNAFGGLQAVRFSQAQVEGDAALAVAAEVGDWLDAVIMGWSDCSHVQRLECDRGFEELCTRLELVGYVGHMGSHRQRMAMAGGKPIVVTAGVAAILPAADAAGERFAVIQLDGAWESLDEERPSFPKN